MKKNVIEAENLVKRFGDFAAVDGVSFSVPEGGITAYLGHNGAGKTTTIRCLLGLLRPTSGRVAYMGAEVPQNTGAHEELRRNFGVCLDSGGFYPELSALENLRFYAGLYGLAGAEFERRAAALLGQLGLADFAGRPVRTFSRGMAQKLSLIKALQHGPKLLFLDEPMSGLDPATRVQLREFLLGLRQERGISIFITSHDLGEVEQLCDEVVILERGRVKLAGPLAELKRQRSGFSYELHTGRPELGAADAAVLAGAGTVTACECRAGVFYLESSASLALEDLQPQLAARGLKVCEFKKREVSLERIYMDLVEKNEK